MINFSGIEIIASTIEARFLLPDLYTLRTHFMETDQEFQPIFI